MRQRHFSVSHFIKVKNMTQDRYRQQIEDMTEDTGVRAYYYDRIKELLEEIRT